MTHRPAGARTDRLARQAPAAVQHGASMEVIEWMAVQSVRGVWVSRARSVSTRATLTSGDSCWRIAPKDPILVRWDRQPGLRPSNSDAAVDRLPLRERS